MRSLTSWEYALIVPSILTESGIIFGADPDSILPKVSTPGS